jgi:hypothetical protein
MASEPLGRSTSISGLGKMMAQKKALAGPAVLPSKDTRVERILECAVILSWNDLVRAVSPRSVHVEYQMDDDHSLEYLKVWSSPTRGHWDLVCEYWMAASSQHAAGLHFSNAYRSDRLGDILKLAMRQQDTSLCLPDTYRDGVVQVYPPTQLEIDAATEWMSEDA